MRRNATMKTADQYTVPRLKDSVTVLNFALAQKAEDAVSPLEDVGVTP